MAKKVHEFYPDFSYGFTPRPISKYIKEALVEKIVWLSWKAQDVFVAKVLNAKSPA